MIDAKPCMTRTTQKPLRRIGRAWIAIAVVAGFVVGFFLYRHPEDERRGTPVVSSQSHAMNVVRPNDPGEVITEAPPNSLGTAPKDAILGEVILHFSDAARFRDFLRRAREKGISPRDVLPVLNVVRLGVDDYESLGEIDATTDFNYLVTAPDIPAARAPDGREYAAFGEDALKWLGADTDQLNWGRDVTIAILDSGVNPKSPVWQRLVAQLDLIGNANGDGEFWGHGTAIATLLAGESGRIDGIASQAHLLSIRVLDSDGAGDSFTVARGIVEAVDRGARVLSLSLGSFSDSRVVREAVAYAQRRNAVIVAAAGNEGFDSLPYPARYNGVIAVTAVDANRQVPYFGNRGQEVDLAAPGVSVVTRWDQTHAIEFTGTSAAVPFISGAIAGVLSQEPWRTTEDAARMLIQYSDDAGAPGADPIYGSGILNLQRLAERNRQGVYRLAVADHYLDNAHATPSSVPVIATIQNRGTQTLYGVYLNVSVDGRLEQTFFPQLSPGATASSTVSVLRPASVDRPVRVTSWAHSSISGTTAPPSSISVGLVSP
jgi:Subtilase family